MTASRNESDRSPIPDRLLRSIDFVEDNIGGPIALCDLAARSELHGLEFSDIPSFPPRR
jgi:hypothetical protein